MPKKTKREKIIAQYHRKLSNLDVHPNETMKSYTYSYNNSVTPLVTPKDATQAHDQTIKRDLMKTLILASIAIGGEIVLSLIMK